jgi:hypothetical protein
MFNHTGLTLHRLPFPRDLTDTTEPGNNTDPGNNTEPGTNTDPGTNTNEAKGVDSMTTDSNLNHSLNSQPLSLSPSPTPFFHF